jgi:hypothetical protein
LGVSAAIKDYDASENIDLRIGEEDPTTIYALQEKSSTQQTTMTAPFRQV